MQVIGASFGKGQGKEGVELAFNCLVRNGLFNHLPYVTRYEELIFDKNKESVSQYLERLSDAAFGYRQDDDFVLTIGGDHTIALGTVAGITSAAEDTSLIWVDSHGDFNDVHSSITGSLHGMPLNGLIHGKKTFNTDLFDWLDEGFIKPENVAIIGVNDLDPLEKEMLVKSGIHIYWPEDIFYEGIQHVVKDAVKKVGGCHLHLSFDLDAIKHTDFHATGCYCPNGMDLSTAHYIIKALKLTGKLKSMDLVEYNPLLDIGFENYKIVLDLLGNLK